MPAAKTPAGSQNREKRIRATRVFASALCVAGLFVLGGCATPAEPENMIARTGAALQAAADSPLRESIAITSVGGGEAPSRDMTYSTVGGAELEKALRQSLRSYGYLSADEAHAPYRLETFLVSLRRPVRGFTMTATSNVRYKLTHTADGKPVYDDILNASATLTVNDEFVGATRNRMVLELSIRRNIAEFLRVLNKLDREKTAGR